MAARYALGLLSRQCDSASNSPPPLRCRSVLSWCRINNYPQRHQCWFTMLSLSPNSKMPRAHSCFHHSAAELGPALAVAECTMGPALADADFGSDISASFAPPAPCSARSQRDACEQRHGMLGHSGGKDFRIPAVTRPPENLMLLVNPSPRHDCHDASL